MARTSQRVADQPPGEPTSMIMDRLDVLTGLGQHVPAVTVDQLIDIEGPALFDLDRLVPGEPAVAVHPQLRYLDEAAMIIKQPGYAAAAPAGSAR